MGSGRFLVIFVESSNTSKKIGGWRVEVVLNVFREMFIGKLYIFYILMRVFSLNLLTKHVNKIINKTVMKMSYSNSN